MKNCMTMDYNSHQLNFYVEVYEIWCRHHFYWSILI